MLIVDILLVIAVLELAFVLIILDAGFHGRIPILFLPPHLPITKRRQTVPLTVHSEDLLGFTVVELALFELGFVETLEGALAFGRGSRGEEEEE